MTIPWSTIGKLAAKAVVWIAPRLGKSPHEILDDAKGEAIREVEQEIGRRTHPSDPPPMTPP